MCRDVVLLADKVIYQDLLLDIWVSAKGMVTVLDWEDVNACRTAGLLSDADLALIQSGERKILDSWRDLVDDFERHLA